MYESGENYLETIFILQKRNGMIRSVDVAKELGFSKPSVSRAIKLLKVAGYIEVAQGGFIYLQPKGFKKAEEIYERHQLITLFLIKTLNMAPEIAEMDACKLEHIISKDLFESIKSHLLVDHLD